MKRDAILCTGILSTIGVSFTTRILLAMALGLLLAAGAPLFADEMIAESEGLECEVCHLECDDDEVLLTDQGRYYQLMETMEGYELVLERFGKCNYCHVAEAGSESLTREGLRFQWMMEDMAGLRQWLEETHPKRGDEIAVETETDGDGS